MFKIAVLVSGSGSNMTRLIENHIHIDVVIADRDCKALNIARENSIDTFQLERSKEISNEILAILKEREIDLVVLAGFLSILEGKLLSDYDKKIINIHPSLLPKYGGKGMHGMRVHRAVFENGEKISGCTVHFVSKDVDMGEIIASEIVDISMLTSPEEIQKKVLEKEWTLLPKVVKHLSEVKK